MGLALCNLRLSACRVGEKGVWDHLTSIHVALRTFKLLPIFLGLG